ncbi:uncharacterized protein PAC_15452 [Phialocephala subalpina]|uniref:Uncharacterized protein n=1 Tax=Phialocephala subalpina TaxID=576137 RepID=A0A1L7XKI3_9HELO|nr:uncharacterized protein PAC_15452 [Phialocephala subalpina]
MFTTQAFVTLTAILAFTSATPVVKRQNNFAVSMTSFTDTTCSTVLQSNIDLSANTETPLPSNLQTGVGFEGNFLDAAASCAVLGFADAECASQQSEVISLNVAGQTPTCTSTSFAIACIQVICE